VEAARDAHDVRRAVRLAVIFLRLVFRRIPRVRELRASGRQQEVRVIALGRRQHSEAPVLGHDRHPVAGQVDRRGVLWCPACRCRTATAVGWIEIADIASPQLRRQSRRGQRDRANHDHQITKSPNVPIDVPIHFFKLL
jgi:hypothetical protein